MQEYEDQNAKLFERETRKVVITDAEPDLDDKVRGYYRHSKPAEITLIDNAYFDLKTPSEYSREEKLVCYETLCNNAHIVLDNSETLNDLIKMYKPYASELFAFCTFKHFCRKESKILANPELDRQISSTMANYGDLLLETYPEAIVSHQQNHLKTRNYVNSTVKIIENKKKLSPEDVANEVNQRIIIDSIILR